MSDDVLNNPLVQQAFRQARRDLGAIRIYAILGDKDGRLMEGLPQNRIRAREVTTDGTYGKDYIVQAWTHETSNYRLYAGVPVVLGYVLNELTVLGEYTRASEAIGINPVVLNAGNPYTQAINSTDLLPLLANAVATANTPSTKIGIKSFRYYTRENQVKWYQGSVSSQVDLASFIPSAGLHRFVCIFFDTENVSFVVKGSTPKSQAIPLQDIDKQECYDAMPPYSIPVRMIRLRDAQTIVTQADLDEDLRPLFGQGTTRYNLSATTAPTTTDDRDSGYGVGSLWIDVSSDTIYMCTDDSVSSANWVNLAGGGTGDGVTVLDWIRW